MPDIDSNIYPVWKPKDITSSEVVRKIKRKYKLDKVGHCGTLDPFAEGILIVLSNEKTAESNEYMNKIKTYQATVVFGIQTDTLDPTGRILKENMGAVNSISIDKINKVLKDFEGEIDQRPPCFSAKKINGIRLYKLARNDVFVHLKPVRVFVESIRLISYEMQELTIEVSCHKGVYIRQLGIDIAKSLGTVGYLKSLVRKSIGPFNEKNSMDIRGMLD